MEQKDNVIRFTLTSDELDIIYGCHTNVQMPMGNYMVSEDEHVCSATPEELIVVILQVFAITSQLINKLYTILVQHLTGRKP